MLDGAIRPFINPALRWIAKGLVKINLRPNQITYGGFIAGGIAFVALSFQFYTLALVFLVLNRISDGLDGAVARQWSEKGHEEHGLSDYGGYLDIVLDMIFYAGFVFFFCIGQPALFPYGAFLIFSFMGTSASFLTYGIIASKRGEETTARGEKAFYHAGGLMEGSETFLFLGLFCLLPEFFVQISLIFSLFCWITVIGRIAMAKANFRHKLPNVEEFEAQEKEASDQKSL